MQELRPSPFESVRKGFSADAEVGGAAASGDLDQAFSGRQSLGGEQSGRQGGHRKTLSLPANDLSQGRPVDRPRSSHPGTRRSHSLQQHLRERFSLHRGSNAVWPHTCCQHVNLLAPRKLSRHCRGKSCALPATSDRSGWHSTSSDAAMCV